MLFSNISSFTELFAGISIAYASSESFSGGFNNLIGNRTSKFLASNKQGFYSKFVGRRTYVRERLSELGINSTLTHKGNEIRLDEPLVDPLASKLKETVSLFKLLHFQNFMAAVLLLLVIAFGSFYENTERINMNEKMIGLVIPPFFSVWILGYLLYPKSNLEQRKSELLFQGSLKLFQLKYEFYIAGFLLCLLCVVLFFPIIMLVPPDSECIFETYQSFLSKFVLCWIVFTMFLPFFLQRRAMKNMYSQFQTASSEAIEVIEHQYQKSLPKLD